MSVFDEVLNRQANIGSFAARVVALRDKLIGPNPLAVDTTASDAPLSGFGGLVGQLDDANVAARRNLREATAAITELEKAFGL